MNQQIKKIMILMIWALGAGLNGQTAINNGNWSNCNTWGYPAYITNSISEGKAINNNIEITADVTWSMAYLNLGNNSAVNINNGVGLDFSTNTGSAQACIRKFQINWDTPPLTHIPVPTSTNMPLTFNVIENNTGASFTDMQNTTIIVPFTGNYTITLNQDHVRNGFCTSCVTVNMQVQVYSNSGTLKYVISDQTTNFVSTGPSQVYYTNVNLAAGDYVVRRIVTTKTAGASGMYVEFYPNTPSTPGMVRFNY